MKKKKHFYIIWINMVVQTSDRRPEHTLSNTQTGFPEHLHPPEHNGWVELVCSLKVTSALMSLSEAGSAFRQPTLHLETSETSIDCNLLISWLTTVCLIQFTCLNAAFRSQMKPKEHDWCSLKGALVSIGKQQFILLLLLLFVCINNLMLHVH